MEFFNLEFSPFLLNFLYWLTCGFGVKPLYSIHFSIITIVISSIIYVNLISLEINRAKRIPISLSLNMYLANKNYMIIPFGVSLNKPGIVNDHDQNQKVTVLDLIYYSISTFTLISQANWYPKNNFRKWVTLEGVLGYVLLIILVATTTKVLHVQ
jgi:hypothetical protein